ATEVYVTGTFDDWGKSTKLEKTGSVFMKKVELPIQNIQYKFVVDGDWIIDPNAPIETDSSGIQNNILVA
ncbi:immunoglobulin E-set, partial [Trichophaea hybrida]